MADQTTESTEVPEIDEIPEMSEPDVSNPTSAELPEIDEIPEVSEAENVNLASAEAPEIDEIPDMSEAQSANPASSEPGEPVVGLARIQQLKVKVQAILGATPISISELANLEKGDVIKLDTKIGDSISILANGDEIARAEIVVTQDQPPKFGLTLTEIIDTQSSASK